MTIKKQSTQTISQARRKNNTQNRHISDRGWFISPHMMEALKWVISWHFSRTILRSSMELRTCRHEKSFDADVGLVYRVTTSATTRGQAKPWSHSPSWASDVLSWPIYVVWACGCVTIPKQQQNLHNMSLAPTIEQRRNRQLTALLLSQLTLQQSILLTMKTNEKKQEAKRRRRKARKIPSEKITRPRRRTL